MKIFKYLLAGLLFVAVINPVSTATADVHCLAQNIYYEARGEPRMGQLAVAMVTINRARDARFPQHICNVVYQPRQFSWTNKNVLAKSHLDPGPELIKIARIALSGKHELKNFDALYFHNDTVRPKWKRKVKRIRTIGKHIFYKDYEQKP